MNTFTLSTTTLREYIYIKDDNTKLLHMNIYITNKSVGDHASWGRTAGDIDSLCTIFIVNAQQSIFDLENEGQGHRAQQISNLSILTHWTQI